VNDSEKIGNTTHHLRMRLSVDFQEVEERLTAPHTPDSTLVHLSQFKSKGLVDMGTS